MNRFFAMISRMKYIDRWGLMNNTKTENISERYFHTPWSVSPTSGWESILTPTELL